MVDAAPEALDDRHRVRQEIARRKEAEASLVSLGQAKRGRGEFALPARWEDRAGPRGGPGPLGSAWVRPEPRGEGPASGSGAGAAPEALWREVDPRAGAGRVGLGAALQAFRLVRGAGGVALPGPGEVASLGLDRGVFQGPQAAPREALDRARQVLRNAQEGVFSGIGTD